MVMYFSSLTTVVQSSALILEPLSFSARYPSKRLIESEKCERALIRVLILSSNDLERRTSPALSRSVDIGPGVKLF